METDVAVPKSSKEKVNAHRARLRAQGLRPIQIWAPDVRTATFKAEARRQSQLVAASVWTVAGGKDYAGKPRPVVIVQDDSFEAMDSVTVCAFTTDPTPAPIFRLPVEPKPENGLRSPSSLMVDKITTVPKAKVGARIGRLDPEDLTRLNQAILVFLGLARSTR